VPARHVGAIDARQHDVERREFNSDARTDPEARGSRRRSRHAQRFASCSAPLPKSAAFAALGREPDRPREQTEERVLPLPLPPTMPQRSPRSSRRRTPRSTGAPAMSTSTRSRTMRVRIHALDGRCHAASEFT
jgi:hypothetical protein